MLDAIATAIIAAMMLVPGLNVVVGIIAGGASLGPAGAFAGGSLGVLITFLEAHHRVPRLPSSSQTADILEFPQRRYVSPIFRKVGQIKIPDVLSKLGSARPPW